MLLIGSQDYLEYTNVCMWAWWIFGDLCKEMNRWTDMFFLMAYDYVDTPDHAKRYQTGLTVGGGLSTHQENYITCCTHAATRKVIATEIDQSHAITG